MTLTSTSAYVAVAPRAMNVFGSLLGVATRRAAAAPASNLRGAQHALRDGQLRTGWLARRACYSTLLSPNPWSRTIARMDAADDQGDGASSSAPPASSGSSGDSSDGSDGGNNNSDSAPPPPPSSSDPPPSGAPTSIQRQSVPEVYPQVLALPIARRPLFPGFYKAVVVRDPQVVAAIKEMMKRGQPYLGAFLLKDDQTDSDVITDLDSVHPVGVFAQITSVFSANSGAGTATGAGKEDDKSGQPQQEGLTAVLYPHRRIRITDLVKAGGKGPAMVKVENAEQTAEDGQVPTPPATPEPESTDSLHPGIFSYTTLLCSHTDM